MLSSASAGADGYCNSISCSAFGASGSPSSGPSAPTTAFFSLKSPVGIEARTSPLSTFFRDALVLSVESLREPSRLFFSSTMVGAPDADVEAMLAVRRGEEGGRRAHGKRICFARRRAYINGDSSRAIAH